MEQSTIVPDLSERFMRLEPLHEADGKTVFERSCFSHLSPFEISAALENERVILDHLGGRGAPDLVETVEDGSAAHRLITASPISLAQQPITTLSLKDKLQIAISLARALARVHSQDIFHLALRPATFLLSPQYTQAVLVDFSSARHCPKTRKGIGHFRPMIADVRFLAPEQGYEIDRSLDHRTDLYSLGCVFYWLFCGAVPFAELQQDEEISYAHIARSLSLKHWSMGQGQTATVLADITHRLLQIEPRDRYQSCAGLLSDLEYLLEVITQNRSLDGFEVGKADRSERLQIPQRLYGREQELTQLMDAFGRVVDGPCEALLVAGYSGVGKSALVNQIQKPVLENGGLFVFGKFDQYRSTMPYSAIEQAFSHFIRLILAMPADQMQAWRDRLNEALAPNAQVLIEIMPDLGRLLGPQPAPAPLGADERQNRFNRVFLQFIHAISSEHKPLVVFIDDLQWADRASIQLLRLLLTDTDCRHCLLLGAYRDNEVDARHPFIQMLSDLEDSTARISQINLQPLGVVHLQQLIADSLDLQTTEVGTLADLVHAKTDGNPFFLRQFLQELYQQELLSFDYDQNRWCWSVEQIAQSSITDNVVALMVGKISRLPEATQRQLQHASCIGAVFPLALVRALEGDGDVDAAPETQLEAAYQSGLVLPVRLPGGDDAPVEEVRFLHDRVQQAAYSLLDDDKRQQLHHRIGRLLLDSYDDKALEEHCFSVVGHFNQAPHLLSVDEKARVIALNLQAAQKAKDASAYGTAVSYLNALFSLSDDLPEVSDTQLFQAAIERIECLFLAGEFELAEAQIAEVKARCAYPDQQVMLNTVLITQYTRYGQLQRAIDQGLEALAQLGYSMPREPGMEDIGAAIAEVQAELANVPFRELSKKPEVQDATVLRTLEILMAMQPCCYNSGSILFPLTILGLLKLTQTHGNSAHSSYVFMMYGLLCTKVLKDYDTAFEAARYSKLIGQKFPANALTEGRLLMMYSNFVLPWQQPLHKSRDARDAAFERCLEQGDYYWGVHAYIFGFYADLMTSPNVDKLLQRTRQVSQTCEKIKQPAQVYLSTLQCNLLQILQGSLDNQHNLDHEAGYEAEAQAHYVANNYMCGKYDRLLGRLLQGYLFGNYQEALSVALSPELTPNDLDEGIFHEAIYTQFNLLSIVALKQQGGVVSEEQAHWFAAANERLNDWYQRNPHNFAPGYFLLRAEQAILEDEQADAFSYYERAIQAARVAGFALMQAVCNERAGRYRHHLQQTGMAKAYLDEAIHIYQAWGAGAKAVEVERFLHQLEPGQVISTVQNQEWQGIVSASQEISQAHNLTTLQQRMMYWSAKVSGAEHVAIYQYCADDVADPCWKQISVLDAGHSGLDIQAVERSTTALLPEGILNLCRNGEQTVVLKDALAQGDFMLEPYVVERKSRSLLCLPLYLNAEFSSLLVLEHRQTRSLFSAQRIRVLDLLSGQYAISLDNILLYQQLNEHNAQLESIVELRTDALNQKTRHLEAILDALPVPYALVWEDGRIFDGNEALLARLAFPAAQYGSRNVLDFYVDQEDQRMFGQRLYSKGSVADFECQMKTLNGELFWASMSATFIHVKGERAIFAAITDISQRKAREHLLHKQANTDPLTGVYNRRALTQFGNQLHVQQPADLWVAMIDLDHFKRLNDSYGHAAGDEVLKQFTQAIQAELRGEDLLGRIGGEEFTVILSGINFQQASGVLERIRSLTEQLKVEYQGQTMSITMSAGLTEWRPAENMAEVFCRADLHLYDAKQQGRNRVIAR